MKTLPRNCTEELNHSTTSSKITDPHVTQMRKNHRQSNPAPRRRRQQSALPRPTTWRAGGHDTSHDGVTRPSQVIRPGLVAITAVPVRHKICVAMLDPQVLLVILDLPTHVSRSLTMHDLLGSPACMRLFTPEGTFTRDLLGSPACLPLSLKSCARGPE